MDEVDNDSGPQRQALRLPEVQLIGAQKAGTSAVADWLFQEGGYVRPRVFDDEPWYYSKEVHFFDSESRYDQGAGFYAQRFVQSRANCSKLKAIDATPDTLAFPERVRCIYEAAGGNQVDTVKIIVILRDPVSRELSLYNHLAFDCRNLSAAERTAWHNQVLKDDGTIMSFDEFVLEKSVPALGRQTGPGRSTRHSMYATHLRKWFQLFDRKQILVLAYDELERQPEQFQVRVQSFLGHKIPGRLSRSNCNDSTQKIRSPSPRAREALLAVFKPFNDDLYRLLQSNAGPSMEQRPFPRFQNLS